MKEFGSSNTSESFRSILSLLGCQIREGDGHLYSVSGCLAGVLAPIELLADANVGRQQVDGSSPWVAAPHMGEPDWVLGF